MRRYQIVSIGRRGPRLGAG